MPPERLVRGAMVVYVATLPLLWPPLFKLPGPGKIVVLSDLAFLVLLAVLLGTSSARLPSLRRDAVLSAFLPLGAVVLSGLLTGAPARALPDVMRIAYSLGVFLLFVHWRPTPPEVVVLARAWVSTAVLVSVVGIAAFLGVTLLGLPPNPLASANSPNLGAGVVRVASTLNSNALSLYLLVAVAFCLFLLGREGLSTVERQLLRGALLGLLITSLFTVSRGLVGLLFFLALASHASRDRLRGLWRARHALAGIAAILAIAGTCATIWAVFPVAVRPRLQLNTGKNAYYLLQASALRMFRARPLLGVGPGGFGESFARFTTPEERRAVWPPLDAHGDYDPHSTWFGWAAETGMVGLSAWAFLYLWILRELLGAGTAGSQMSRLAGLALIGLMLNGFHAEISHLKFIWALLGIGIGAREGLRGS